MLWLVLCLLRSCPAGGLCGAIVDVFSSSVISADEVDLRVNPELPPCPASDDEVDLSALRTRPAIVPAVVPRSCHSPSIHSARQGAEADAPS